MLQVAACLQGGICLETAQLGRWGRPTPSILHLARTAREKWGSGCISPQYFSGSFGPIPWQLGPGGKWRKQATTASPAGLLHTAAVQHRGSNSEWLPSRSKSDSVPSQSAVERGEREGNVLGEEAQCEEDRALPPPAGDSGGVRKAWWTQAGRRAGGRWGRCWEQIPSAQPEIG